ncbi:BolA family protein [Echinimonas agarilytica]|uniref:BolA family transcriptional regulator n=1 Tax=Echinimonas agarilytica TaxID=1215918 RepID=A0AA42B6R4_9GAMM|nr:BolA family protein [Echinimonas agarilytica]MCM2678623.1 BolA family transcriptional regulator [Echinimonas agarilytica]
MEPAEIKALLEQSLDLTDCHVESDGSHYKVIAVGEMFDGLSRVKAQQAIYQPLQAQIADGSLHALTIKTYTPTQWQRERKLMML